MDRSVLISSIELMLGAGVLQLEVGKDQLSSIIDLAFRKIAPYVTDEIYCTKPYACVIDLTEDGFEEVIEVIPSDPSIITQDRLFDFEYPIVHPNNVGRYIRGGYPLFDPKVPFKFLDGKLYLDGDRVYSAGVTIRGIGVPTLESLKDERARIWVEAYSLALAKEVCGRIRSKFKASSLPVELDGDTLLSEAQVEKQQLEQELSERQFGLFVLMK